MEKEASDVISLRVPHTLKVKLDQLVKKLKEIRVNYCFTG